MEIINISYPGGYMNINLETFFPTSQSNFKKLLKVIDMDWQNKDRHIRCIKSWITDEIKLCEDIAKGYANKYVIIKPIAREAEAKLRRKENYLKSIEAWKKTEEYKEAKQELKEIKREFSRVKGLERNYNSSFKHYHSRKEKLQRNLGMLQ